MLRAVKDNTLPAQISTNGAAIMLVKQTHSTYVIFPNFVALNKTKHESMTTLNPEQLTIENSRGRKCSSDGGSIAPLNSHWNALEQVAVANDTGSCGWESWGLVINVREKGWILIMFIWRSIGLGVSPNMGTWHFSGAAMVARWEGNTPSVACLHHNLGS